jgi:hypothetical protein
MQPEVIEECPICERWVTDDVAGSLTYRIEGEMAAENGIDGTVVRLHPRCAIKAGEIMSRPRESADRSDFESKIVRFILDAIDRYTS